MKMTFDLINLKVLVYCVDNEHRLYFVTDRITIITAYASPPSSYNFILLHAGELSRLGVNDTMRGEPQFSHSRF